MLSLCAGDGRDLIGVLERHPRRGDVHARLIELDPDLVAAGNRRIDQLGLQGVSFLQADAGRTATYDSCRDLHLVLACGIFGNVSDEDIRTTILGLSVLLAAGGSAIWTRHRLVPDVTHSIREWFATTGFDETAFVEVRDSSASVGVNRLVDKDPARSLPARLFAFVGDGAGGMS